MFNRKRIFVAKESYHLMMAQLPFKDKIKMSKRLYIIVGRMKQENRDSVIVK